MNTMIQTPALRRLPSIDWIALGIGVLALILSRIQMTGMHSWVGLFGLAVFGPPVLRELGWLKDDDEFCRDMRRNAGFHAALAVGLMLFLNEVVVPLYMNHPEAQAAKLWLFPNNILRQTLVLVFLFSYLIQYWGPAKGVFRILLGMAVLTLIEGAMVFQNVHQDFLMFLVPMLAIALLVTGLAFLSRRQPRLVGWSLLVLGMAAVGLALHSLLTLPDYEQMLGGLGMRLGLIQSALMFVLIFGILGLSLLHKEPVDEDLGLED